MRNLVQYPITDEEIIECLETLSTALQKERGVGDLRPALLLAAADKIRGRPRGFGNSGDSSVN